MDAKTKKKLSLGLKCWLGKSKPSESGTADNKLKENVSEKESEPGPKNAARPDVNQEMESIPRYQVESVN